ncbi:MAG: hypothetical protein BGO43_09095 [Gammaproteobacteria bacterium 39-13]|nr:hypothetical protein [Gammaproteobacteria bacterium]OJV92229.1 MAG: hypothetical protein BGO43_09095 [Gammaproteobacteria bacterium 39-13]
MKQLDMHEIQCVSGGSSDWVLLDISLLGLGAFFGSLPAYIKPLMDFSLTSGPMGTVAAYTPNTLILFSGLILGASAGFAFSKILQEIYYSSISSQCSATFSF